MSTSPKTRTPFLQGRIFELVICASAFIVVLGLLLQIPLSVDGYDDRVTSVTFATFAIVGVVAALMLRHGTLTMLKDTAIEYPFHRWLFFWLLPPAIFILQLPWILSGVYNADDVNTIGALAMMFFIPWLMVLLGFLAVGVFWAPLEMTIRGAYRAIVTKGKETGQLGIGAYLLLWVAIIICGVLGASTDRVSYQAHGALVAALLGLPGDYTIKDPTFLWITRGLLIIAIAIPLIFWRKKPAERPITKRSSIRNKE